MDQWLSPRAYIISMTAAQTRQFHAIHMAQAQASYERYVSGLAAKSK